LQETGEFRASVHRAVRDALSHQETGPAEAQ
jgi:hypothetical protein